MLERIWEERWKIFPIWYLLLTVIVVALAYDWGYYSGQYDLIDSILDCSVLRDIK